MRACRSSTSTPTPCRYMHPQRNWAWAWPCSAARVRASRPMRYSFIWQSWTPTSNSAWAFRGEAEASSSGRGPSSAKRAAGSSSSIPARGSSSRDVSGSPASWGAGASGDSTAGSCLPRASGRKPSRFANSLNMQCVPPSKPRFLTHIIRKEGELVKCSAPGVKG